MTELKQIYTVRLADSAVWVYGVKCAKTPSGRPNIQVINLTTEEKYARSFADYNFAVQVAETIGGVIDHWTFAESDYSCVPYEYMPDDDDDEPVGYWVDEPEEEVPPIEPQTQASPGYRYAHNAHTKGGKKTWK